jgi:hypothetical protein
MYTKKKKKTLTYSGELAPLLPLPPGSSLPPSPGTPGYAGPGVGTYVSPPAVAALDGLLSEQSMGRNNGVLSA